MVSTIFHLGRGPLWRSILLAGVIFLGLTHTLLADPTSLVLTLPILGMITVAKLLLSSGRRELLTIILCWVGIGLAALALGYAHYLAGLLTYSAAAQFPDLSKRPLSLYSGEVSLLLWTPIHSISTSFILSPERMMVGGGLIGCLAAIWLGSPRQRELALSVLTEAVLIAVGVSKYWLDFWFGPGSASPRFSRQHRSGAAHSRRGPRRVRCAPAAPDLWTSAAVHETSARVLL
jgi:TM2 domain-containing membrane protein YozV